MAYAMRTMDEKEFFITGVFFDRVPQKFIQLLSYQYGFQEQRKDQLLLIQIFFPAHFLYNPPFQAQPLLCKQTLQLVQKTISLRYNIHCDIALQKFSSQEDSEMLSNIPEVNRTELLLSSLKLDSFFCGCFH